MYRSRGYRHHNGRVSDRRGNPSETSGFCFRLQKHELTFVRKKISNQKFRLPTTVFVGHGLVFQIIHIMYIDAQCKNNFTEYSRWCIGQKLTRQKRLDSSGQMVIYNIYIFIIYTYPHPSIGVWDFLFAHNSHLATTFPN